MALILNASSCEGVTSVPWASAGEREVTLLIQEGLLNSLLRYGLMGLSTAPEDVCVVKKDREGEVFLKEMLSIRDSKVDDKWWCHADALGKWTLLEMQQQCSSVQKYYKGKEDVFLKNSLQI